MCRQNHGGRKPDVKGPFIEVFLFVKKTNMVRDSLPFRLLGNRPCPLSRSRSPQSHRPGSRWPLHSWSEPAPSRSRRCSQSGICHFSGDSGKQREQRKQVLVELTFSTFRLSHLLFLSFHLKEKIFPLSLLRCWIPYPPFSHQDSFSPSFFFSLLFIHWHRKWQRQYCIRFELDQENYANSAWS